MQAQNGGPLAPPVIFHVGAVSITATVVTTWGIVIVLALAAWAATRRTLGRDPGMMQTALEGAISAMRSAVAAVVPATVVEEVFPFIATLWIFLVIANLCGVVPGLQSPTGDLATTAALAILVFFYVHWLGIKTLGLRAYLRHYLALSPLFAPFEIISEITRTVTLAVRLFGNMMSLELAAMMVLLLAGFLVPIPVLMLHIVEALIQAYIFGMLALVYIGGAVEVQVEQRRKEASP